MSVDNWNYYIFALFLVLAAWQDFQRKSVAVRLYLFFGLMAVILKLIAGHWGLIGFSGIGVGLILLAIGRLAGGAIGSGDGWFFVVGGIYLGLSDTIRLLMSGVFLCGLVCLGLFLYGVKTGKDVKKMAVPFLPFLIPAWIWMVFL